MNGKDCLSLAACDQCALGIHLRKEGRFRPVPAELNSDTLEVLPFPSKRDELRGAPGGGPDGAEALEALERAGYSRDTVSWTTTVACRYPKDKKKEFDVKAWAARAYSSHKDHLDAMIKELAKYKDKAQLDLVA